MDTVKEVCVRYIDKDVSGQLVPQIRISIYFDYVGDSYYVQFPHNVSRNEIASLLMDLSQTIMNGDDGRNFVQKFFKA